MSENYRPRHSLDSRYENFDLDFDLNDDEVVQPYHSSRAGEGASSAAQSDIQDAEFEPIEEEHVAGDDFSDGNLADSNFADGKSPEDPEEDNLLGDWDEDPQEEDGPSGVGLGVGAGAVGLAGAGAAGLATHSNAASAARDGAARDGAARDDAARDGAARDDAARDGAATDAASAGSGAATAGAGASTAAAAGHADQDIFNNGGQPADADTKGLPIRGLIMVLAAVGVLLVGWGAITLVGNNGDDKTTTASSDEAANSQADQNAAANGQAADANAANGQDNQAAQNGGAAAQSTGANPSASADADKEQSNSSSAAAGEIDPAKEYIAVLNNSQVGGLASDIANKIKAGDFKTTGYGNLPTGTFPESVVLYPGNNNAAKTAAEKLASQLGITAQARTTEIDQNLADAQMFEGAAPGQIVVITTNDMPK